MYFLLSFLTPIHLGGGPQWVPLRKIGHTAKKKKVFILFNNCLFSSIDWMNINMYVKPEKGVTLRLSGKTSVELAGR